MARKSTTFNEILDKYDYLVEEYVAATGEDLWSLPSEEVDSLVSQIRIDSGISAKTIIINCLRISIDTGKTLTDVLNGFIATKVSGESGINSIQRYFKDIAKIYNDNNNNYDIDFTPENRDKIIGMNLKSVITIAKGYQGLGVDLSDLISAGNEGLCRAYAKYDPTRAKLKSSIIEATSALGDTFTFNELKAIMDRFLTYGDVRKKFIKAFKPDEEYTHAQLQKWIDRNIHNAKFNSVACKWILAYIINEINTNSRLVKKPKSEIDRDREETGYYVCEKRLDIDAPISPNSDATVGEILDICSDDVDATERDDSYKVFKSGLNTLLTGVKSRDRRIILRKFGIGLPRPMEPGEIAVVENLSVARISQIIQSTLKVMKQNYEKYNVDPEVMMDALSKIK